MNSKSKCYICGLQAYCSEAFQIGNGKFLKERFGKFGKFFENEENHLKNLTCDECLGTLGEIRKLGQLLQETEKKIEVFLESLEGKLLSFQTNIDIVVKSENDKFDDNEECNFDPFEEQEDFFDVILEPDPKIVSKSPNTKKRKLNCNDEVFEIKICKSDTFYTFPVNPGQRNHSQSPGDELIIILEDFVSLLPPEIKDDLKNCKFSVNQKEKEKEGIIPKKRGRPRKDASQKSQKDEIFNDEDLEIESGEFSSEIEENNEIDEDDEFENEEEDTEDDSDYSEPSKPQRKINYPSQRKKRTPGLIYKTKKKSERSGDGEEEDPRKLKTLTEINGNKYYMHYIFKVEDGQFLCGFDECEFKTDLDPQLIENRDQLLESRIIEHIHQVHPPKKPTRVRPALRFPCELCPEVQPLTLPELRKHFKGLHPDSYREYDPRFGCEECRFCGKPILAGYSTMKYHEWIHFSKDQVEALIAQGFKDLTNKNTKPKKFKCTEENCSKIYTLQSTLDYHILRKHRREQPETFLCPTCGQKFSTKRGVDLHVGKFHDPDQLIGKWRMCRICDAKYLSMTHLESHMANQHGAEKKIVCDQCGLKFANMNDLRKHLLSHAPKDNMIPFTCSFCKQTYRYKKGLYRHIEKVHGIEHRPKPKLVNLKPKLVYQGCKLMYPCTICDKAFEVPSKLKKHYAISHQNGEQGRTRKRTNKKTFEEEEEEFNSLDM